MKYFGFSVLPQHLKEVYRRLYEKMGKPIRENEKRAMLTWAPSHVETGLLSEILGYANLINGLHEIEKRGLKDKLQGTNVKWEIGVDQSKLARDFDNIYEQTGIENFMAKPDPETKEWEIMFELLPKYVDYLRNLLKPHLK